MWLLSKKNTTKYLSSNLFKRTLFVDLGAISPAWQDEVKWDAERNIKRKLVLVLIIRLTQRAHKYSRAAFCATTEVITTVAVPKSICDGRTQVNEYVGNTAAVLFLLWSRSMMLWIDW